MPRARQAGAALAAGLASLALSTAFAASANARPALQWRGVDAGGAWHALPVAESRRDLHEAAALGSDTVRVILRWNWLSPEPHDLSDQRAGRVHELLGLARKLDLRVVATTLGTPCWAVAGRSAAGRCTDTENAAPPSDPADYGRFISFVVRRWGKRLAAIEVWNEPNRSTFWRGSSGQYVGLVREARRAIDRSRHRELPLVGGALAGTDTAYLRRLYAARMHRFTDAISIHPYDLSVAAGFRDPSVPRRGDPTSFAAGVPAVRQVMRASGDRDPIWITEFGLATCPSLPHCVSERVQSAYLDRALKLAAEWKYVDVFLIFRLRDSFGSVPLFAFTFGLLNRDWSRKPAARSVHDRFVALRRGSRDAR